MRKQLLEHLVLIIAVILILLFTLMFYGFLTHSSSRNEINIFIVIYSFLLSICLNFGLLISSWTIKSDSLLVRIGTSVFMLPMLMLLLVFVHQSSLDFYYINKTGLVNNWLSLIRLLIEFGLSVVFLSVHVVQILRVLNYREPKFLSLDIK